MTLVRDRGARSADRGAGTVRGARSARLARRHEPSAGRLLELGGGRAPVWRRRRLRGARRARWLALRDAQPDVIASRVQRWHRRVLLVCAGCTFSVDALQDHRPVGDPDLAVGDPADWRPGPTARSRCRDLTAPPPPRSDADPCAGAPRSAANTVAAACVIGQPPTIDGDLTDWPTAQFLPLSKTNAAQANGTWDDAASPTTRDSSARYSRALGSDVSLRRDFDHRRHPRSTPNHRRASDNDALEIFVDGKHDRSAPATAATTGSSSIPPTAEGRRRKVAVVASPRPAPPRGVEAGTGPRSEPSRRRSRGASSAAARSRPGASSASISSSTTTTATDDTTRDRDLILL